MSSAGKLLKDMVTTASFLFKKKDDKKYIFFKKLFF